MISSYDEALCQHGELIRIVAQQAWNKYPSLRRTYDVDDLRQEARLELWESLQTHDPSKSPLSKWFQRRFLRRVGTAVRAENAQCRRHEREILDIENCEVDDGGEHPIEKMDRDEQRRRLILAIRSLSQRDQAFILQRFGIGTDEAKTFKELSALMGVAPSNCLYRCEKILLQLQSVLNRQIPAGR